MYSRTNKISSKQKYQKASNENYNKQLQTNDNVNKNNSTVMGLMNSHVNLNLNSNFNQNHQNHQIHQIQSKNQKSQYNQLLQASNNLQNLQQNPNVQQFNNKSYQNNKKTQLKQFVSLQQALNFLNFINKNQQQAFKEENIQNNITNNNNLKYLNKQKNINKFSYAYNNKDFSKLQDQNRILGHNLLDSNINNNNKDSTSDLHRGGTLASNEQDEMDGINQNKKKLNQNRAIKRVIETAFGILQKNYRYGDGPSEYQLQEQRSTSTQFNIYMKQYNRIIEQINRKQLEKIQKINALYQNNQDQLQEVFEYTVAEDFREKLGVLFSKEKITKQNVEMMMERFKEALVMLRPEGLKVEFIQNQNYSNSRVNSVQINPLTNRSNFLNNQQQPYVKSLKITQIQNVEYFTQPYVFIAISINKDKTKSREYLYLRFPSQQNQDKWDRALYCCYMSKKMSKKSKLFEIEFPVQDVMKKQKEEHIKQDQQYNVGLNEEYNVIGHCFSQKYQDEERIINGDMTKRATNGGGDHIEGNMLTDRSEITPNKRYLTDEKIKISILNAENTDDKGKKLNTVQNKGSKYQNPFKTMDIKASNHENQPNKQTYNDDKEKNDILIRKNTSNSNKIINGSQNNEENESGHLSKKQTLNMINNNNQSMGMTKNTSQQSQYPLNPFMKLLKIAEEQSQKEKRTEDLSKTTPNIPKESANSSQMMTEDKMKKLKRLRELKKNNVRGIVCQKEKFFINKEKILFLGGVSVQNDLMKDDGKANNIVMKPDPITSLKEINQKNVRSPNNTFNQQILQKQNDQLTQFHNQFIQYYDYDYKKDLKTERKVIPISSILNIQILPSTSETALTTSLVIEYEESIKNNKKQLRLLFANNMKENLQNGNSKAYEVYDWVMLLKEMM